MSIFDYDDCDQTPETLDQSAWESMGIEAQIEHLNRAWEEKTGEIAPEDCDQGDWGAVGELDQADYYSISPNGDPIPW